MKDNTWYRLPTGTNPMTTCISCLGFRFHWTVILMIFVLSCPSGHVRAGEVRGVALAAPSSRILYSENLDVPFIPASTLKILTALAAFHYLGEKHRFITEAFLGEDTILYVKGYGDPLFTSEAVARFCSSLAEELKLRGKTTIRTICVDGSFFEEDLEIPGTGLSTNPYDAAPGALSVNFNTVNFTRNTSTGEFVSAEPETPLLPFVMNRIRASGQSRGRIILNRQESLLYPGMIIRFYLRQQGIDVADRIESGKTPMSATRLLSFISDNDLTETVKKLLAYSNNFMANQLLLSMGAEVFGEPATLSKGLKAMRDYATGTMGITGLKLVEGSGLSRGNRITPRTMLTVLEAFKPYHSLMSSEGIEFYKTGTLQGVRARAGYFRSSGNTLYPFAILVNQDRADYTGIRKKLRRLVEQAQ